MYEAVRKFSHISCQGTSHFWATLALTVFFCLSHTGISSLLPRHFTFFSHTGTYFLLFKPFNDTSTSNLLATLARLSMGTLNLKNKFIFLARQAQPHGHLKSKATQALDISSHAGIKRGNFKPLGPLKSVSHAGNKNI